MGKNSAPRGQYGIVEAFISVWPQLRYFTGQFSAS